VIERLENPVFRQSSRQRMRGARTYGCLMAYLLTLGGGVLIAYLQFIDTSWRATTGLAQALFEALTLTQWFLVAIVAPALTTSAISMEREQRTFDLLIMTPLSRFAIVWGKFVSALAFLVVLIVCGIPMVAVLFLLGGIDLAAVVERYAGMLITGAVLAALGVSMSAVCGTSTLANLITYGVLAGLYLFGMGLGMVFVLSRAFGGGISGGLGFFTWWGGWRLWVFVVVLAMLMVMLLLQIGANYLLPDPRAGAWKSRVWTALLFVWCMLGVVWTAGMSATTTTVRHVVAIAAVTLLQPIAIAVSTGVLMGGRKWYQWLLPRALPVGTVQTGLPYLLLLLLVAFLSDLFVQVSYRSSWLAWAYTAGHLWWLWCLGYACSVLINNRWGAGAALFGGLTLGGQFIGTITMFQQANQPHTTINLVAPMALYFSRTQELELWSSIYPIIGLTVLAGAAWLRHRRLSRGGQEAR